MFKVHCESCQAPYDIDESRVPAGGLKMRCPKCGTSFMVNAPSGGGGLFDDLPAPVTKPKPGVGKSTVLGLGPAVAGKPGGATLAGPGPALPARPARPALPEPEGFEDEVSLEPSSVIPQPPEDELGIDLPALRAPGAAKMPAPPAPAAVPAPPPRFSGPGAPAVPRPPPQKTAMFGSPPAPPKPAIAPPLPPIPSPAAASAPSSSLDLPEPSVPQAPAANDLDGDLGIDLPAPRASSPRGGAGAPSPGVFKPPRDAARVSSTIVEGIPPAPNDELDLPAAKPAQPPAFGGQGTAALGGAPKPFGAPPPPLASAPLEIPRESGVDLPAPKAVVDLPAAKAPPGPPKRPSDDLDLPTARRSSEDLDIPARKAPPAAIRAALGPPPADDGLGELDLPMPKGVVDLPAAKPTGNDLGDLDLPVPKGVLDLPAPKAAAGGGGLGDLDLPAPKGSMDLPAPKGVLDLPAPKGVLDLPAPKGLADLPQVKSGGLGDLDLPAPKGGLDLPVPKGAGGGLGSPFGDLDLPVPKGDGDLPAPLSDFANTPLDSDFGSDLDGFGTPSSPPGARVSGAMFGGPDALAQTEANLRANGELGVDRTADGRTGLGGTSFGEVDLDGGLTGGAAELGSAAPAADEMEFGDIPQQSAQETSAGDELSLAAAAAAARENRAKQKREEAEKETETKKKRKLPLGMIIAVLLVLVIGGTGAALGATNYGFFGIFLLEQYLPEKLDAAQVESAIDRADRTASEDTFGAVRTALRQLGVARHDASRHRGLMTRAVVHECLYQVRFGDDDNSTARIAEMIARLEERGGDAPGMALARAADALRRGAADQVGINLGAARAEKPNDAFVDLVAGEAALRARQAPAAVTAFKKASEHNGGARAYWGLARAYLLAKDDAQAKAAIEQTLQASPLHASARIAKARFLWQDGDDAAALAMTREAAGIVMVGDQRVSASRTERASALALAGRIHEKKGRLREARESYELALHAEQNELEAMLGLGRVLVAEKRYQEALARFEAVVAAGSNSTATTASGRLVTVEAGLGAARAMLALDRTEEGRRKLAELVRANPTDAELALWLGKADQELRDRAAAEQHFRDAIRLNPRWFDGYIALAQLFFAADRGTDAAAILEEAKTRVQLTAEVHRMLGQSELLRNRQEEAAAEFRLALSLDDRDAGSLFGLGVALRRGGKLQEAAQMFDRLSHIDDAYPGLALERGLVYEAQGQSTEAVAAYESALRERNDDPELLLRLGAAQVAAGLIDRADETLRRVAGLRPNSAEAEHFMGRVAFARGNVPEALAHFDRAVQLDGTRGEFRAYLSWALLDSGNLARAREESQAAIEKDSSLGDAYWIRGVVRLRTGAVQDALADLQKAVELKPARTEAWAAMGDCFEQLRRRSDAIAAYERAISMDDTRGEWWYRLGRIRLDAGQEDAAKGALSQAVLRGEASPTRPGWLADAHRILGDALRLAGDRPGAIEHYRRYLALAPNDAIDVEEVRHTLRELGVDTP